MTEDFLHLIWQAGHAENIGLPTIDAILIDIDNNDVPQIDHKEDIDHPAIASLNDEQSLIANDVLECVEMNGRGEVSYHSFFYLDSPWGCGNTLSAKEHLQCIRVVLGLHCFYTIVRWKDYA